MTGNNGSRNDQAGYRINERIREREVRLVGENVEQGVYPIEKAPNSRGAGTGFG